jgi:hypothetical protein
MLPLSVLLRRIAVRLTGYAAIASRTHGEKFGLSSASGDRWRTDCVATIAAGTLARVSRRDEKSSLNRFWLPGTTGIRRSPRPLWAENSSNASGASRGEDANVSLPSLRGAKRRSNPYFLCGKMDCFAALAMTARAMDCFAPLAMTARQDGLLRGACHRARIRATRWLCAEHDRQLGGESLLSSLMVAKD